MTQLERILHEMWLQEFMWTPIEVLAPIYDLICNMMSQCGLVFVRHEEEWRIVMQDHAEAVDGFPRTRSASTQGRVAAAADGGERGVR